MNDEKRPARSGDRPSVAGIVARAFLMGGLVGFLITLLYITLR